MRATSAIIRARYGLTIANEFTDKIMTVKEFKIWLITNDYTQKSLASKLGMTERTIANYVARGVFPRVFIIALKGLEK